MSSASTIEGYRMSPQQRRLWLLHSAHASSASSHGDVAAREPSGVSDLGGGLAPSPYWSQCAFELGAEPDMKVLRSALLDLHGGVELLRTRLVRLPGMALPLQVVDDESPPPRLLSDSSDSPDDGDSSGPSDSFEASEAACAAFEVSELMRLMRRWRGSGVGSGESPLLAVVTRVGERHVLVLGVPSLYGDSRGVANLGRMLRARYEVRLTDAEVEMDSGGEADAGASEWAGAQYADLAEWQNELLESGQTEAGREYWRRKLTTDGAGESLEASASSTSSPFRPAQVTGVMGAEQMEALRREAGVRGVGAREWVLACWWALWARTKGRSRPIAVRFDGRNYEELEDVPGLFTRYLPINFQTNERTTFSELLRQAAELTNEAYQWQECFTWDQFKTETEGPTEVPFIPICFDYEIEPTQLNTTDLPFTLLSQYSCTERYRVRLRCRECGGGGLAFGVDYDSATIDSAEARRTLSRLLALLADSLSRPDAPVARLSAVGPSERRRLLGALSGASSRRPAPDSLLHDAFREQARLRPTAVALVCEGREMTYAALDSLSDSLAATLRLVGVGPERLVGVMVERSEWLVVSILGVLKAGGAYVPVDTSYPGERVRSTLRGSGACALVSRAGLVAAMGVELVAESGVGSGVESVPVLPPLVDLDAWGVTSEGGASRHSASRHDEESGTPQSEQSEVSPRVPPEVSPRVPPAVTPDSLAYVIYTSGSTGTPKGVMVTHRQLMSYVAAATRRLDLPPRASFALVSTPAADLGHTMLFTSLASGGRLHVVGAGEAGDPRLLAEELTRRPVDCLKVVPSHLRALMEGGGGGAVLPLRRLVLGGEATSGSLLRLILRGGREWGRGCEVYNHYGPTEATVGAVAWRAAAVRVSARHDEEGHDPRHHDDGHDGGHDDGHDGGHDDGHDGHGDGDDEAMIASACGGGAGVALGRPLENATAYVLDARMELMPEGETGELYVGGDGVARGYLDRPGLTAERFLPDPYSVEPGARVYRTGDLVRHLADGRLEFLGRADHQVKVRGYRVELGEVEAALLEHAGVREAVVVAREVEGGERRLVAYVVAARGRGGAEACEAACEAGELREHLRRRLPDYMVPSAIVVLDELPLTQNGKVDRRALPEVGAEGVGGSGAQYVMPRTPVEEAVCGIFAEVLGVERVGATDDFFELGGHSLLATQVVSRIRAAFNVDISLGTLFDALKVGELARRVEREMREGHGVESLPVVPVDRSRELPLSFAQQRLWFLDHLEPGSSFYNIFRAVRLSGVLDVAALERALNEIIKRHEALRTTFETVDGSPLQRIAEPSPRRLEPEDVSGTSGAAREDEVLRLAREESRRPFDLAKGPLMRVRLLRESARGHVLLLTMHHIISDGWSMGLLVKEFVTLFRAFASGAPSPLAPLPIQYADYAVWQREWLQGEVLEAHVAYWKKQLAGAPPLLELPADRPRPDDQSFGGARLQAQLGGELTAALEALSRREGATLFMTLMSAFQLLLHHLTERPDVVVGTDVANRNSVETEGVVGFFINQLVLRTDLSGDPTFRELMARVREVVWGAHAHQELPFDRLVEALNPERSLKHAPLFQVKLVFQNLQAARDYAPDAIEGLAELGVEGFEVEAVTAKFDLTLNAVRRPDAIVYWVEYNTSLFNDSTAARFAEQFETILRTVASQPDLRVGEVRQVLADAEKERRARAEKELREARMKKFKGLTRKSAEAARSGAEGDAGTLRN